MSKWAREVEDTLAAIPVQASKYHPEGYIGGGQSKLRYLGHRWPDLRARLKRGFSFSRLSDDEQARVWDEIWNSSDCFEVMALAIAWYSHVRLRPRLVEDRKRLLGWASRIDNWAHSDGLSALYARIFEERPDLVKPIFEKWSRSKNPWLRRQSVVGILNYSAQRTKVPPAKYILTQIERQLEFDHYYVQKGVGWTIRECFNLYPEETFRFVKRNILRISPAAYYATTEKMTAKQKAELKALRSLRPKKSRD